MWQSSRRSSALLPSRSRRFPPHLLSPTSFKNSRAKTSVSVASSTSGARLSPSRRCLHSSILLTTAGHQTQIRIIPPTRSSITQVPSALRIKSLVLPSRKSARFRLTIRLAPRRITVSWRVPYSVVPFPDPPPSPSPPLLYTDRWKVADTPQGATPYPHPPFSPPRCDVLILVSSFKPNRASLLHPLQMVAVMGSRHAHPFKSPAGFPPRTRSSTNNSRYSPIVTSIRATPSTISRLNRNTIHSSWQVSFSFDSLPPAVSMHQRLKEL